MAEDKLKSLFYGEDAGASRYPFLPFVLAPVGLRQDSIILGPYEISSLQNDFINTVYRGIEHRRLDAPLARIVTFGKDLCVAVLVPTNQADEAGRAGLIFSFGFLAKRQFAAGGDCLAAYLRTCLVVLERNLVADITGLGAGRVVAAIQATGSSDNIKSSLLICRESLLVISAAAGSWLPIRRFRRRFPWYRARPVKTIIHGSSISIIDALCEVLAPSRSEVSGYRADQPSDLWILPWPTESWILENAKSVTLANLSNKPFLVVQKS